MGETVGSRAGVGGYHGGPCCGGGEIVGPDSMKALGYRKPIGVLGTCCQAGNLIISSRLCYSRHSSDPDEAMADL